jgi:hypothetical protein
MVNNAHHTLPDSFLIAAKTATQGKYIRINNKNEIVANGVNTSSPFL